MKKKAGQAPSYNRVTEPGNKQLVPVNNTSNKVRVSSSEASKVVPAKAPARSGQSTSKSTAVSKQVKADPKKGKGSVKSTARAAKHSTKRAKSKKKGAIIAISVVAALLLAAGGVYYYLYSTGFFKPTIEVTMADGTMKKIKVEEAYAELMTDKFFSGTVIDGIEVGGMTVDEAFNAVSTTLPDKPLDIDIKLNLEGKKFPVDFSDASFEYNTREVVEDAFTKFRPLNDTDLVQLTECYNGMEQLKNTPQEYETAYTVQIEGVSKKVHGILDPLILEYATVQDARIEEFDKETRTFTITPEQVGYVLDIDGTADAVKKLFDSKKYTGVINVPTVLKEPEVTEAMLNDEFGLIGEMTTKCSNNSNRNNNISKACEYINGTILEPGDKFSFNKVVGQRTYDRGFKEANVILGGQYEKGLGGGVCQASSTLFNAVAKSDLKVIQRNNHAWPSDYVLTGCDATVNWPDLDFQFENDSDFQVIISMWFDWSDLTVHAEIYGKKFPDGQYIKLESNIINTVKYGANEYVEDKTMEAGKKETIRAGHDGYTARIYKVWFDKDGNEIKREEYYTTTYKAWGPRVKVGVLKADGTYATINKETGELTDPTATPTPTPGGGTTTATPTTAPQPTAQDTPTNTPTTPPEPTTDPGGGGSGEGGSGEGGSGSEGGSGEGGSGGENV